MTQETAPETPADDVTIAAPETPVDDVTTAAPAPEAEVGAPTPDAPATTAPPSAERQGARWRRTPKQDPLLIGDVATARAAVAEIAEPSQIGSGHRVVAEEDRLAVHLFECTLPGYRGWNWFASLARAPRSRTVTVCEIGLLPGEDALMAPEWVPWSDRVSPEERAQEEQAQEEQARTEDGAEPAADASASPGPAGDAAVARGTDREPPRDGDRP